VACGAVPPGDGVAEIVALATDLQDLFPNRRYVGDGMGLEVLVSLYYSKDDAAVDETPAQAEIDGDLVEECRRLLKSRGA
jgi:hypothetical protein